MALLILNSIQCIETAETFGDELYVTFNGTKRSLPNMTDGDTAQLGQQFVFSGPARLNLFENDGDHWYDRDDFIAGHMIQTTPGELELDFKATSGNALPAHYKMSASVDPAPATSVLVLNYIHCIETAETFGDELYVTFNGTRRSLPNMTDGDEQPLGLQFVFTGSRPLSLFENDGDHWYDRDDFIGSNLITPSTGTGDLEFKATSGHGVPAHYLINVSVSPVILL